MEDVATLDGSKSDNIDPENWTNRVPRSQAALNSPEVARPAWLHGV
jgi:hypothetical protein